MKLLFICGCLEPGYDGVGDYVRLLAVQLKSLNVDVAAISLYDSFVKEETDTVQSIEGGSLSTLRIPKVYENAARFKSAKQRIDEFNPTWLSLQFVPYSFNDKGLPFKLAKHLKHIGGSRKWHIMFHELWLDKPNGFKQHLTVMGQRFIIKLLKNNLQPSFINTSIEFNRQRLQTIGIKAVVMEIFGNILKAEVDVMPAGFDESRGNEVKILYFGSPPKGEFLNMVIKGLSDFITNRNFKTTIVVVAKDSDAKVHFIQTLQTQLGAGLPILNYSFLDDAMLSTVLSYCTVGIVRSEPELLGKSGSAIAMLEHGLPIWLPKWKAGEGMEFDFRKDLIFSDLSISVNTAVHQTYTPLLPKVAAYFKTQLTNPN